MSMHMQGGGGGVRPAEQSDCPAQRMQNNCMYKQAFDNERVAFISLTSGYVINSRSDQHLAKGDLGTNENVLDAT